MYVHCLLFFEAREVSKGDFEGLNKLKQLADRSKLTKRLVKQAKHYSLKYSPKYKYGFEIPKNFKDD